MSAELARVRDEAEAHQLPALIDDWSKLGGPRGRIARALRIDLALLEARPELALACLHRRAPFDDTHLIPRPWLRALRPPADAGTVEEYRTSADGPIAFSADGAVIGVVGAIAWERVTGRHADPRRLVPPPAPRWERTPGTRTLRRSGVTLELPIGEDDYPGAIYELDDAHVVVATSCDGPDAIYLVNAAARRVVWRIDAMCTGAVRAGDRVIVISDDAVTSYAFATGRELARQYPGGAQVALGPHGSVAVRAGHGVRVCDLDARPPAPHPPNQWPHSMFSPSGDYLLTGATLGDGRTDRTIATLPLVGTRGWLLGRPTRNGLYVADDLVFELMPHGLRAWRTHDGGEVFHDRQTIPLPVLACWSANATHVAVMHRRGGLAIYDPRMRGMIARHQVGVAQLAFAGDGFAIETVDGQRLRVTLANPAVLEPWTGELPEPHDQLPVRDGLVELAGATIPIDDEHAVRSADGRYLAGRTSHYGLDG